MVIRIVIKKAIEMDISDVILESESETVINAIASTVRIRILLEH